MKWNLFVDAELNPIEVDWAPALLQKRYTNGDWYICRTLAEAEQLIYMYGLPDFVSLSSDDLGVSVMELIAAIDAGAHVPSQFSGMYLDDTFNFWVHSAVDTANLQQTLERQFKKW